MPALRTCLIVDDSSLDQQMMHRAMDSADVGVDLLFAGALSEARAVLKAVDVSLMFLDNSMPDGWGADFVCELARDPQLKTVPVIIVSDWPSPFLYAKARAANVREVWSKRDFTPEAIRRVVQAQGLGAER
ncbi:response regulator [Pseudooceanicola sp. 502str34]|uniref:response regulator n=1 Tax=Maritimibacter alkaliphilus TaxID=404236 RepID=UPI001C93A7BF|nr:response regulator [Maritimibacter alkaliphilus]MBY6089709.1 response regulator [Maritimibacter alkaliphilus]